MAHVLVRVGSALALLCACGETKPLREAILGEWDVWCRTDAKATATCIGKEDDGLYKRFMPGGLQVSGARNGTSMEGMWTLNGEELVLLFEGGNMRLEEAYHARIEDDRLVLWDDDSGYGVVHGRVGATFDAAASKVSNGDRTTHTIGGVRYSVALPEDYRLVRDDNQRQTWAPSSGEGLTVGLTLSPRPQTQVDGVFVTPPCNDFDYGGISGSRGTIDGIDREVSIGKSFCLDGSDQALSCSGEHTRGWLAEGEKDPALALCTSVTIE